MNGIEPNPAAMTPILRSLSGDLFNKCPDIQQMRLMTNPGIATDAKPCQIRVSAIAVHASLLFVPMLEFSGDVFCEYSRSHFQLQFVISAIKSFL